MTSLPFGVVNAPGQRYHPAIVAQAMATRRDSTVIAVHNLSSRAAESTVELGAGGKKAVVHDLLEDREHAAKPDGTLDVALDGYGYLWLRVLRSGQRSLT